VDSRTNRVLVILLMAALFVSVFGTLSALNRIDGFKALTGLWGSGSETRAATNVTISSNLAVNFSDDTADFGTGYVQDGYDACTIGTDGTNTSGCVGFSVPNGLILENTGNRYARINITNTNYSNSLLGGTKSGYAWMWDDPENDDATCSGGDFTGNESTWSNITAVIDITNYPESSTLCDKFNYTDDEDTINISIKFHIDVSALARSISDTWLVEAVDVGQ